jgi:hypothetical protein
MPFLVHRLGRECQSFDELRARIVPVALEVHMAVPLARPPPRLTSSVP